MENNRLSFIEILEKGILIEDESVRIGKIVIPMIQRDYAQGRLDESTERVRKRFLDALYKAIVSEPITLGFIYGDIDKGREVTPLDGQQRLTTLFLLHWYAAKKENITAEEGSFLRKFSYETRDSARDFCKKLVDFKPSSFSPDKEISEEIKKQRWFRSDDWENDPTISGMLVMLDAIHEKFNSVSGIWKHLKNKKITFDILLIKEMALTDEIYIRMNSRGKSLTEFEYFKAELERNIKKLLKGKTIELTR